MRSKFKGIKYCLWDVDLTFYSVSPRMKKEFRHQIYNYVAKRLGISKDKAKKAFEREFEKSKSKTAAMEALGLGKYAIQEAIDSIDKRRYLKKDLKLINLFKNLNPYQHAIITNTTKKSLRETLKILGLKKNLFKAIVTKEDVVNYKPHPEPFLKALALLGAKAKECISIGDNESSDITPARKLGIRTIFVYGKSKHADASVPIVYDVQRVLL